MNQRLSQKQSLNRIPSWVDVVAIFLLAILINGYRVGEGPLAGTEGHRAIAAHQMVTGGDWLLPKLYDQLYLRKPPLHYWILALLEKVTGRADELIWRLPSVISAALMAVALYAFARRWYGRLAGLVSGVAACDLVAIWMQNRTAEIDALNTLACVVCACFIIDALTNARARPVPIGAGIALSFAGVLLAKGPAGATVIAGAILGPPLFNRHFQPLKKRSFWLPLLIGLAISGVYAWLAYRAIRIEHLSIDASGLREPAENMLSDRRRNLVHNLALPFTLLAFGFPVSMAIAVAIHPAIRKGSTDEDRISRALLGTMAIACALTMAAGMVHERYSYVWLPLLCPLAGGMVAAWKARRFPPSMDERFKQGFAAAIIMHVIACVVVCCVCYHRGDHHLVAPICCCIIAAGVAGVAVYQIRRDRLVSASFMLIALIAILAVPMGALGVVDRYQRSTFAAAEKLSSLVPPGTRVVTGDLLMDQPELFYYAHVNVESYPGDLIAALPRVNGLRWLVIRGEEYDALKLQDEALVRNAIVLRPARPSILLVPYQSPSREVPPGLRK